LELWRHLVHHSLGVLNLVIISYFVVGNGVYSLLMGVSLVRVWLRSRQMAFQGLEALRHSPAAPPVTVIVPAWNERNVIVESLHAILKTDYPQLEVTVVDDGSSDGTLARLIAAFDLEPIRLIYRAQLRTSEIEGFYRSHQIPNLLVVSKGHGGKSDALNAGINLCRTPYFCTLDADSVLEPDALLRLMQSVVRSPADTVASGGIVRVRNGCEVRHDRVTRVALPPKLIERFQVVEYLRTFLLGRTGWDLLGATMIVSGAFAVFHRATVAEAGGFSSDTVTEDLELITRLHRWALENKRRLRVSFTPDPVCWTECPSSTLMLGRQRRRWQVGLCQTLWKNRDMIFNRRYGALGLVAFPFHAYVEALGAVVEPLGYLLVPLAFAFHLAPRILCLSFLALGLTCAGFLTTGAIVLEELTYRRYPSFRDFAALLKYALLENLGYRQLILFFRLQGVVQFLTGFHRWERVVHVGPPEAGMAVKPHRLGDQGSWVRPILMLMVAVVSGVRPTRAFRAQETTAAADSAGVAPCQQEIAEHRGALESSPGNPALELPLARSLALCGQDGEAISRYLRTIAGEPGEVAPRIELGGLLVRAQRSEEAIALLREALRLDPENDEARLGLARALAATGNNLEALLRYDEVLAASPGHYDALQGKAFVLYHSARFAEARTVFEILQRENPSDTENAEALAGIARAEIEARAAASTPVPSTPPDERLAYYRKQVASDSSNRAALLELGRAQAELKDFPAAVGTYRRLLAINPDGPSNDSAKFQLARTLAWSQQYDASIALYQELLRGAPRDADFLEGLARVATWSGRMADALSAYQRLADTYPSEAVLLQIASLDFRLHYNRSARAAVERVLAEDPENRDARRLRAQIELRQGHTKEARQQFTAILKKAPHDPEALLGEAEAWYYLGRLDKASEAAGRLRQDQPQNADVLLLLARLDRARGDRKAAMAQVKESEQVSPSNPEAKALESSLRDESASTLHTSAAYAHEIGLGESLTTFTYGTDFGFKMLRRTDSTFSLDELPSQSPSGAIQGAAAPSQFLYRQTTSLSRRLTVRAGIGLVRFGPSADVSVPGQPEPITSAGVRPIGLAGASAVLTPKITADFNWTRAAVSYTPLSVRLGVIDQQYDAGLSFRLSSRTELHLEYFHGVDGSKVYAHIKFVNPQTVTSIRADRLPYSGGAITFSQSFIRSPRFSFDAGYSGLDKQFVNSGGPGGETYLGFFEPALYQCHLATARFFGKLWGPVGYDFSGGFGAQQVDRQVQRVGPFTRAFNLSPVFTLRASPRLTLRLGYTYYNFAQTLGAIRGDSLRLTTDWKF